MQAIKYRCGPQQGPQRDAIDEDVLKLVGHKPWEEGS